MTTITPQVVGGFEGPAWLRASRSAAAERVAAQTLPSAEEEIWRYSRIAELDLDRFVAGAPVAATVERGPADLVAPASADEPTAGTADLFTDLNAALASRHVVRVPAGRVVAEPLVLVHTLGGASSINASQLVIEAGANAEITVVERFVGGGGGLVLPATRLVAHPSARIRYVAVNELDRSTWFIAHQVADADRDATVSLATVAFGGDYARVRTEVRLVGQGAHAEQIGLSFGEGNQMHDLRVLQEHVAPRTTSNLLFKGAVQDSSRSVYTGLIRIGKLARGANAFQTNRNLKLSEDAWADSVPNLDIENNDVRCSHASHRRSDRRRTAVLPRIARRPARARRAVDRARVLRRGARQTGRPVARRRVARRGRRQARPEARVSTAGDRTHDLGPLVDLADGTARRVELAGRSIALVRIGDKVYALGDTCSHADVSLSEGEVLCDTLEIECWKHGSAFSLTTGEPQTLPATQPVPVYDVAVVDDRIVLTMTLTGDTPRPVGGAAPRSHA